MSRTQTMKGVRIPNIIGADRWLRDEMISKGYKYEETQNVLADHSPGYTLESAFKRYFRVGQKSLYYGDKRIKWAKILARKWLKKNV